MIVRSFPPYAYILTSLHVGSEILGKIHVAFDSQSLPLLIFVNKGIEQGTQALTLEIIVDTCGPELAKVSTFLVGDVPVFVYDYH
jgi:hypothetical protein